MNYYRTVAISDVHLGTKMSQPQALLEFIKTFECERLYLVGDIIDGWRLKKSWFWPQSHNDVIQKLLRKVRKGAEVFYIPGNHDEVARQFVGMTFGEIQIKNEMIHVTADGKKLWVTHGDLFDSVMQYAKWLAYLGDTAYTTVLVVNRWFNNIRIKMGFQYWSLSQFLKHKVKNAVSFIADFEAIMAREARKRKCDGVVCGHIHKAEIRDIDGLLYCNDGDWVESLTALVETFDGELRIIHWPHILKGSEELAHEPIVISSCPPLSIPTHAFPVQAKNTVKTIPPIPSLELTK